MGAWGGRLYESDFACDLRADIKGYMRVPISDDEILAKIEEEHGLGHDGEHVDGFDYWLVLADQLERHGMPRPQIFARAIEIVEGGLDVAALAKLNAGPQTLASRRKDTAKLVHRLRNPRPAKKRRPLKAAQPLLFEVGDLLVWPTDRGNAFSEYLPDGSFQPDGWGFGVITGSGHDYGVFAYHWMRILMWRRPERPSPEDAVHCRRSSHWRGAIPKSTVDYLRIEKIGHSVEAAGAPRASHEGFQGIRFSLDAFNRFFDGKFNYPPVSGIDMFPDEPEQRPFSEHRR